MNQNQAQQILAIVEKLEIFKGLTLNEAGRLLKAYTYKTYEPGEKVYRGWTRAYTC